MPESDALSNSAKLRLFAAFTTVKNFEQFQASFARHVEWAGVQEAQGHVFMMGPLTPQDPAIEASGLTLYRMGSLAEAEALAQTDPFIADGGATVHVRPWMVLAGSVPLSVRFSNSSIAIR